MNACRFAAYHGASKPIQACERASRAALQLFSPTLQHYNCFSPRYVISPDSTFLGAVSFEPTFLSLHVSSPMWPTTKATVQVMQQEGCSALLSKVCQQAALQSFCTGIVSNDHQCVSCGIVCLYQVLHCATGSLEIPKVLAEFARKDIPVFTTAALTHMAATTPVSATPIVRAR